MGKVLSPDHSSDKGRSKRSLRGTREKRKRRYSSSDTYSSDSDTDSYSSYSDSDSGSDSDSDSFESHSSSSDDGKRRKGRKLIKRDKHPRGRKKKVEQRKKRKGGYNKRLRRKSKWFDVFYLVIVFWFLIFALFATVRFPHCNLGLMG